MRFYDKYLLPRITHFLCGAGRVRRQRAQVVPLAEGRVLEIGIGTGLNLPLYQADRISRFYGLDPSLEMWEQAGAQVRQVPFEISFLQASAEQIPLEDDSLDTVVSTYTLCSIQDLPTALAEMRRVLKPGGRLLFCEHGLAPEVAVQKWQRRIGPVWEKLGGGCQLDRAIPMLLEQNGFTVEQLETGYMPGFKPACYNYWGRAIPL